MYVKQCDVDLSGCTIVDSVAEVDGGALMLDQLQGASTISDTNILGGRAGGRGGAIAMIGAIEVHLLQTTVGEATAGISGGLIHIDDLAKLQLTDVTLANGTSPLGSLMKLGPDSKLDGVIARFQAKCGSSTPIYKDGATADNVMSIRGIHYGSSCATVPPLFSGPVRLPYCEEVNYEDNTGLFVPLCGPKTICTNAMLPGDSGGSGSGVTYPVCTCAGAAYPSPTASNAALAPFSAADGCVEPVVADIIVK
eukprot:7391091-Prymnesium_polylepis.1